jgi:hypothetical protein
MPLWGNKDNAANSDIAAVSYINRTTTAANQTALYGNTRIGQFVTNTSIGQFAVDTNEMAAANTGRAKPAHSGWVIRREGTGLRAGRVTYEVLVATGSISTDGSDDTQFPDYRITITTNPSSANGAGNVNLTVAATSTPSGATLAYAWQRNPGSGWVSVPNTAGVYFNNTSPTLVANAAVANANTFRVLVSTTGANTVTSANAAVTTP